MAKNVKRQIGALVAMGLTLMAVIACDHFMSTEDIKGAIRDTVAEANAKAVTIYMDSANHGEIDPSGSQAKKIGIAFDVSISPDEDYGFIRWAAYDKNLDTYSSDDPEELETGYVSFTDASATKTKATIVKDLAGTGSDKHTIAIRPVYAERPYVATHSPLAGSSANIRNVSLVINFNKPVDPATIWELSGSKATALKGIRITQTWQGNESDKSDCFELPSLTAEQLSAGMQKITLTHLSGSDYLFSRSSNINVFVSKTVSDINGFSMVEDYKLFSFAVGSESDALAPDVAAFTVQRSQSLAFTESSSSDANERIAARRMKEKSVYVTVSASDENTGGSYVAYVRIKAINYDSSGAVLSSVESEQIPWDTSGYDYSFAYTLPEDESGESYYDGIVTLQLQVADTNGNLSAYTDNVFSFVRDISPPSYSSGISLSGSGSGSYFNASTNNVITLNGLSALHDANYVAGAKIPLNSASLRYQYSLGSASSFNGTWLSSSSNSINIPTSVKNGDIPLYLKFADDLGNASLGFNVGNLIVDTVKPSGSLSLNNVVTVSSKDYIKSATASLSLSGSDANGIASYMVSTSPTPPTSLSDARWKAYKSGQTASLGLGSGDGSKTAYAFFKDVAGNISDVCSDAAILDSTPPSVPVRAADTSKYVSSSGFFYVSGGVKFTLSSSESGSGLKGYSTSSSGASVLSSLTLSSGSYKLYGVDYVGNVSSSYLSLVVVQDDDAPPVPSALTPASGSEGNGYFTSDLNQYYINESDYDFTAAGLGDPGSGLKGIQYSTNGTSYTTLTLASAGAVFTLPAGTKGIRAIDNVGNVSSPLSVTVAKDSSAPDAPSAVSLRNVDATYYHGSGTTRYFSQNPSIDFNISCSAEDSGAGFSGYTIDGGTSLFTNAYVSLNAGSTYTLQAVDKCGNVSSGLTVQVIQDTSVPNPPSSVDIPLNSDDTYYHGSGTTTYYTQNDSVSFKASGWGDTGTNPSGFQGYKIALEETIIGLATTDTAFSLDAGETYYLYAVDNCDNQSSTALTVQVIKDTTAPDAPSLVSSSDANYYYPGSGTVYYTGSSSISFTATGWGDAGSSPSGFQGYRVVSGGTITSLSATTTAFSLAAGESYQLYAVDNCDNQSTAFLDIQVIQDDTWPTAPTSVSLSGTDDTYYHVEGQTTYFTHQDSISFTATGWGDTGSNPSGFQGYKLSSSAGIISLAETSTAFTLNAGTIYYLYAVDNCDNQSALPLTIQVIKDATLPTAPGSVSLNGTDTSFYHVNGQTTYYTQNTSISFTASDWGDTGTNPSGFQGYRVSSGGTTTSLATTGTAFSLAAGSTYHLYAVDNCDNQSSTALTIQVIQDTSIPDGPSSVSLSGSDASYYHVSGTSYFTKNASISFTASGWGDTGTDPSGFQGYRVSNGGTTTALATTGTAFSLAAGSTYYLYAVDNCDNQSALPLTIQVIQDTTLPTAPTSVSLNGTDDTYYHVDGQTTYYTHNDSISFTASGWGDTGTNPSGFQGYRVISGDTIFGLATTGTAFSLDAGETYYLYAVDNCDNQSATSLTIQVIKDATLPTAPGSVSLNGTDTSFYHVNGQTTYYTQNASISFTASGWGDVGTDPSGFQGYRVESGGTTTSLASTGTAFSLAAGSTYYLYAVDNCDNQSATSLTIQVIKDTSLPDAPSSVSSSDTDYYYPGSGSVYYTGSNSISFTASGWGDTGTSPSGFQGYRVSSGGTTTALATTGTAFSLTAGSTYYLYAVDNCDNQSEDALTIQVIKDATLPTAPTSVSLNGTDDTYYHVSGTTYYTHNDSISFTASGWGDTGTSPSGFQGYRVITNGDITSLATTATAFSLDAGETYYLYAVDNCDNQSATSLTIQVIKDATLPTAPGSVSLNGTDTSFYHVNGQTTYYTQNASISFTASGWGDTGTNPSGFQGYRVSSGGTTTSLATTGTAFTLNAGSTYYLYAVDNCDNQSSTALTIQVIKDTSLPDAPSSVSSSDTDYYYPGSGTVYYTGSNSISFTASGWGDAGTDPSGFQGYRVSSGGTTTALATTGTAFSLAAGSTYYLYAVDNCDNQSEDALTIQVIKDATLPTAPTSVSLNGTDDTYYHVSGTTYFTHNDSISFTASGWGDTGTSPSGFQGYRIITNGDITSLATTGTAFSLDAGETYYLYAVDNCDNQSSTALTIQVIKDATLPTAPSSVSSSDTDYYYPGSGSVYYTGSNSISFTASGWGDTGTSPSGFQGYRVSNGGTTTALATTGTAFSLAAGSTYYLYAVDNCDNQSSTALTIQVIKDATLPTSPTSVSLSGTDTTYYHVEGQTTYFTNNASISFTASGWDDAATNKSGFQGYRVVSEGAITSLAATTTAFTLNAGSTYYLYAVDNCDNQSEDAITIQVIRDQTQPTVPTSVSLDGTDDSYYHVAGQTTYFTQNASISFTASGWGDTGTSPSGFQGYRVVTNGDITSLATTGTAFSLNAGSTYYLYAVDNCDNQSSTALTIQVIRDQVAPPNVTAVSISSPSSYVYQGSITTSSSTIYYNSAEVSSISLSLTASVDANSGTAGFRLGTSGDIGSTVSFTPTDNGTFTIYQVDNVDIPSTTAFTITTKADDSATTPSSMVETTASNYAYEGTVSSNAMTIYYNSAKISSLSFTPGTDDAGSGSAGYATSATASTWTDALTLTFTNNGTTTVYQKDNVGNVSGALTITWKNDIEWPVMTLGTINTSAIQFTVSDPVTSPNSSSGLDTGTWTVTRSGGSPTLDVSSSPYSISTDSASGTYVLTLYDNVGHKSVYTLVYNGNSVTSNTSVLTGTRALAMAGSALDLAPQSSIAKTQGSAKPVLSYTAQSLPSEDLARTARSEARGEAYPEKDGAPESQGALGRLAEELLTRLGEEGEGSQDESFEMDGARDMYILAGLDQGSLPESLREPRSQERKAQKKEVVRKNDGLSRKNARLGQGIAHNLPTVALARALPAGYPVKGAPAPIPRLPGDTERMPAILGLEKPRTREEEEGAES